MKLTKKHIKDFCNNGYVLFEDYLDFDLINKIKSKSKEIFGIQIRKAKIDFDMENEESFEKALFKLFKDDYSSFIGAAKLCQQGIELHQLAVDKQIIEIITHLGIENPAICVKPIVFFNSRYIAKQTGHYKTPPHQDWRSMQGSVNSIVVWIPLMDLNHDLGTLEVIPESHRDGLFKTTKDEWFRTIKDVRINKNKFVSLEVKKGDVVCFNSFLAHKSGNNSTRNIRWSMHFRYNDINEKTFIDRNFPHPYSVYIPSQEILHPEFDASLHLNNHLNNLI